MPRRNHHQHPLVHHMTFLGQHGVAPGAYIYVADAALVTEDNLAALGDTSSSPAYPPPLTRAGGSSPRPWRTTPGRPSASSPTRSRPRIVLRRLIKSRRARSRSSGRPIAPW